VHDPAGRIVYSAHLYFDADHSGQYRKPYAQDGATPEIGAHRLAPFVGWLRLHHLRGQIGEMGVPYDDPAWLPVLDRFLTPRGAVAMCWKAAPTGWRAIGPIAMR
jgi:endoglucanase